MWPGDNQEDRVLATARPPTAHLPTPTSPSHSRRRSGTEGDCGLEKTRPIFSSLKLAQIAPQPAPVVDGFSVEAHRAAARLGRAIDDVQQCRLARSAYQPDDFGGRGRFRLRRRNRAALIHEGQRLRPLHVAAMDFIDTEAAGTDQFVHFSIEVAPAAYPSPAGRQPVLPLLDLWLRARAHARQTAGSRPA